MSMEEYYFSMGNASSFVVHFPLAMLLYQIGSTGDRQISANEFSSTYCVPELDFIRAMKKTLVIWVI